ncbi:MAG: 60S ribosomal protein L31, partial [Nitrosopumilus sp.]|nr:60S ribosomal protein L31 [Nitrosopumilus sp.]
MSQELERVYTIPLGKVLLSQSQHRAVRAINMIKEFARHHMKVEDIKIEEDLAHQIWAKGVRSPPRKIRVRMSKTDEGYVLVSPYEEELESKVTPEKETPKVEDKVEEPAKEAPKEEEPAKEAPKEEE